MKTQTFWWIIGGVVLYALMNQQASPGSTVAGLARSPLAIPPNPRVPVLQAPQAGFGASHRSRYG